jgi:hypothetical protein
MTRREDATVSITLRVLCQDTRLYIRANDSRRHQGWSTVMPQERGGSNGSDGGTACEGGGGVQTGYTGDN